MSLPALRRSLALLKSADIGTAKTLRDKARAIETYSKQAKEAGGLQREAAEIRIRAERRIGELLRETVRRGGAKSQRATLPPGISKTQSSRWQLIARLPEETFEQHVASKNPTTAKLVCLATDYVRRQRRGPAAGGNVYTCDLADLPAENIDLILTDPPWSDIAAYGRLAEWASDKLKPGGLCLAYSGTFHLPAVLAAMGSHLQYHWTFSVAKGGTRAGIYARKIQQGWRPIVAFSRGPAKHDWVCDSIEGSRREKELHIWQQPQSEAEYLIERLTGPGALVVDPFCGSGTVLAAARSLGRRWIGCDIDGAAARTARRRVA